MHTNRKDKAPLHRCGTHQCNQVNFFHSKVSAFSIFFFQKRALNLILKTGFKLEDGGNAVRNATNFSVNAPVETASLEWFWPMQKLQWSALFGLSVQGFQPVCASNPQNNNNFTRKKTKNIKNGKGNMFAVAPMCKWGKAKAAKSWRAGITCSFNYENLFFPYIFSLCFSCWAFPLSFLLLLCAFPSCVWCLLNRDVCSLPPRRIIDAWSHTGIYSRCDRESESKYK